MAISTVNSFIRKIVTKELEIVGAKETFEDMLELSKQGISWYDNYQFQTMEDYEKWKTYCLTEMKTIKGFSKKAKYILEREFSWLSLQYGFSVKE